MKFIVLLAILLVSVASETCPNEPLLDTVSGSVSGVCKRVKVGDEKWDNIYSWLSIPYAKPPVGDLRFQAPQSYGSWAGNLDGTKYPSFCMNLLNKTTQSSSEYLTSLFGSSGIRLSEDCLYLNIFMSEKVYKSRTSSSTPILVYFQNGNQNLFNPAGLVIQHDIIFITINYRLDVFGFLHIKDDDSSKDNVAGNQAILDQSMALKWISESADKFGGDSKRVTLLGMYYGANLIGYQMMYKPSFPFFRNVILNSGTPINLAKNTITSQLATARAKTFIKEVLKCKSGVSLLQCARRVDSYNLTMASRFYVFNKMSHQNRLTSNSLYSAFGPVADGQMFTESAIRAFRLGHFKKCNVLTGYKTFDSFTLLPFDFLHNSMIRQDPSKRVETITFTDLVHAVKKFYSFYPTHPFNHTDVFLDTVLIQYTRLFEKSHFEHPSLIKLNYYPTFFKLVNDESFACPTLKLIDNVARYSRVYLYINDVPDLKLVNNSMVGFMLAKPGPLSDITNEMNERWANFVKYDSPNSNSSNITWPHYLPYDNSQDTQLDDSLSECVNDQAANSTQMYLGFSTKGVSVKRMKSTDNCIVWNTLIPATMDSLAELRKYLAPKCPKNEKKGEKKPESFFKKFKFF